MEAKKVKNIASLARGLGIRASEFESCGHHKAKLGLSLLERVRRRRSSKYILVSAMTPTASGLGKTVTTIGLSMALNRIGASCACVLRQASLGPLFGSKGGGCGGGASRLVPEDEVGLHLTGDAHAAAAANNLLVAFAENSVFHGNPLHIDPQTLTTKRCLDSCDRSLRHIRYALKSLDGRHELSTGFEMTAASEVMSILSLSRDFGDLRRRLAAIAVGRTKEGVLVMAEDIKADGMMAAVLKDAARPNLVRTSEGTPCLIHAGPFANVSVGSSSVIADRIALGLCDVVVTESGFGADCGAEKFFDIKCRASGLVPDACVLVCSVRAVKAQSHKFSFLSPQKILPALSAEDAEALEDGLVNLRRQIENVRLFGIPVVVAINVFGTDTEKELGRLAAFARDAGAMDCARSESYRRGSRGALELAQSLMRVVSKEKPDFRFLYGDDMSLKEKIKTVAAKIYGAGGVDFSPPAREALDMFERDGRGRLPVCIAKTQFSLSHDENLKGAPSGFVFPVVQARLLNGAGFVLAASSLTQAMPGLPEEPKGACVDVDRQGRVLGLS